MTEAGQTEAAGIRLRDLRPDGSVKVMGKGAKEWIVPIGTTARGRSCATSASVDRVRSTRRSSSAGRGALERILGHIALDMVKRYVSPADADLSARHRVASPADRLIGGRGR